MAKFQQKPELLNAKLTAIWAVSESGLGGLLHAVKIPFSGLFLGSFAVIIITYFAYTNKNRFSGIMKATLLVVLIKAIVSPHSPPMAYVAVLFQGVLGAIIYGTFGVNRLTAIGFGALALLESAFQKILTLTIIFGKGLWESIQQFFDGMQNRLHAEWLADLPWLFLILYGAVYFIIGMIAGNLAVKLPQKVFDNAKFLQDVNLNQETESIPLKKRKKKRISLIVGLLLFSSLVFLLSGAQNQALYIVLRTLAAVVFFLFVFNPLFKYVMKKWVAKEKSNKQQALNTIMAMMPIIKNNVGLAQQLSVSEKSIWKRGKSFVITWLSLSLYFVDDES